MIQNFLNGLTRDTGIRIEQDGKTWCQLGLAADGSVPWRIVGAWLDERYRNNRACKMCGAKIHFAPHGEKAVPLRLRMDDGGRRLVVVNHFTDCTPHLKSKKPPRGVKQQLLFEEQTEAEAQKEYPD